MRRGPYQPSATATAADDNPKAPDDYLTDDLTRTDLIYVLRNLRFRPPNSDKQRLTSIVIDRGVRDYLLRALKPAK
jgi:hypothetical protein